MSSTHLRFALAAAITLLSSTFAEVALAQSSSVYVLGIRSVEGDDEFARELSGAIRVAAGRISGWEVAADEVSLSQMTMMHGCSEPNAECMTAISQELSADKIIYGTVRRAGTGDTFDYALSLYMFEDGAVGDRLSDNVPQAESSIDDLQGRAERYVAQLSGQARYGSLRLEAGEANAAVSVDGSPAGMTNAAGTILVEDLTEGSHEVTIEADGFEPFSTTIEIEADEQTEVRANLALPGSGGGPNLGWLPGAALIAGGVITAIFASRSGLKVLGWKDERDQVDPADARALMLCATNEGADALNGGNDANCMLPDGRSVTLTASQAVIVTAPQGTNGCDINGPQWRDDICDYHSRQRTLQFVLWPLAAVSTGVGAFLLLRALGGDDDDDDSANVDVDVQPWMAGRDGGVNMTLTW